MKFNITVELEWMGEEGDLDAEVKGQIIDGVVSRISKGAVDEVTKAAKVAVEKQIAEAINIQVIKITEELLSGEFDITDRWGDKVVSKTTVKGELKKSLDAFLTERVDKEGRPVKDSYGTYDTRMNWLIKKNYTDQFDGLKKEVDALSKRISTELKAYIDNLLKAQLGESIAKAIGLDTILKTEAK